MSTPSPHRARAPHRRRRSILGAFAVALGTVATGCATPAASPVSTPAQDMTASEALAGAPRWVTQGCRAFWQDAETRRTVVCGIGSAPDHRNRVAARETAIARARTAVARSLEVTIESLVRLTETGDDESELATIVHQLSSTSLRGVQLETTWRSETGEIHALVSLGLDQVQHTVRNTRSLPPADREGLAQRAADAFAQMDAAFQNSPEARPGEDGSPNEP